MESVLAFTSFFILIAAWIIAPAEGRRRPQPVYVKTAEAGV